jgi:NADPH:quinone reductase
MKAARYGTPDVIEPFDVELPPPEAGQVTIAVRAAGVNPTDWKGIAGGSYGGDDASALPKAVGYEVAGTISAIGPDTEIASGGGAVGDAVIAFRVTGGYTEALNVPAEDVFAKPAALDFPAAANLLLVGATAADMLHVTGVASGETVLVHGASGGTGASVLQQAAHLGAHVIGTASEHNAELLRRFGATPVSYGDGLEQRVRDLAPEGVDAALDCVGTPEAIAVSLALVHNRDRIVTIVAQQEAATAGIRIIGGRQPASLAYRASVRQRLVDLAADGRLLVPVSRTYPLREAARALEFLKQGHPGGKLALIP